MAVHEQAVGKSDEWYTPAHVFEDLGVRFDMDVASPEDRTFIFTPAAIFLTAQMGHVPWKGFIWMNPPFGGRNGLTPWLDRFFAHGNGVCLVPDRTSAPWWQNAARRADMVLFVAPRLRFLRPDGSTGNSPAQGTVLMAVGPQGTLALLNAAKAGLGLLAAPMPHSGE